MYHGDFSRRIALRERYRQAHLVGIRAMSAFIRHLTFENYKQIGNYISMCEIKDINVSGCHLLKTLSASIWVRDLGELGIGLASDCTDVPEIVRAVQARWVDDPSRCFGIARRVTSVACTVSPSHGPGGRMILVGHQELSLFSANISAAPQLHPRADKDALTRQRSGDEALSKHHESALEVRQTLTRIVGKAGQ